MGSRALSPPCLLGAWLLACGPVAGAGGEESGGSGTGESGSGETGDACKAVYDETLEGPTVAVTLRNEGDAPIYLAPPIPCTQALIVVEGATGVYPNESCATCEAGTCSCPKLCESLLPVLLFPGHGYEVEWDGSLFESTTLLEECAVEAECAGATCSVRRQADAASLAVRAGAYPADACASADCMCDPGPSGWCIPAAGLPVEGTPSLEASAPVVYPDEVAVEVVFGG